MREIQMTIILFTALFACCSNGSEADAEGFTYDPDYGYSAEVDTVFIDSFFITNSEFKDNQEAVMEFYSHRNYRSAWFEDKKPKPQAEYLLQKIRSAREQGLSIGNYSEEDINSIEERLNNEKFESEAKVKDIDLHLTNLYFQFGRHLNLGMLQPDNVGFGWHVAQKEDELVQKLNTILNDNGNSDPFALLEPDHKMYRLLKQRLADYREIQRDGGWEKLDDIDKLEYGDSSEAVVRLRKRLFVVGDIPDTTRYFSRSIKYDSSIVRAVKKFQARHGLELDGIVGGNTLNMLNMTVEEKINKIIINMERFRWLPDDMGDPHIVVNIPAYKLYVREGDREVMEMKVVTGEVVNKTILFSDTLEYIEMSPYWNVPYSITSEEILPKAKSNPGYITANNFEVLSDGNVISPYNVSWNQYSTDNFPYRIRQKPGPSNSLGTIKFIFPNRFMIYLHDTPAKHLFDQAQRDFSHGCIRVEKPLELAKYILQDRPEWDAKKIQENRGLSSPVRVDITREIPVYILYFTTWIDSDGSMQFREDIYGHDEEIAVLYFVQN